MADIRADKTLLGQGCSLAVYRNFTDVDDFVGTEVGTRNQNGLHYSVTGVFGTGGSFGMEGSADGVSFSRLTDYNGVDSELTAAGTVYLREVTRFIRPVAMAGSGYNVTITIAILQ